jgi:hypothetical protein
MAYNAIVIRLKNVRPHSNADKVQLATCHGNQVVVGLETKEGDWGVYFPCDGQLSDEFCKENNLYRDATKNSDTEGKTGMFDDNRRVRAQKFRGEISDGFWVPLHYFGFISVKGLDVEGFEFDTWKDVPICNKYVNQETLKAAKGNQPKQKKKAKSSVMFVEHIDTKHMIVNIEKVLEDDLVIISSKQHGTSGRVGYVLVDRLLTRFEKIAKWFGIKVQEKTWSYLNGTRRVVIEESSGTQFHDPTIRDVAFNKFKDNLRKGESVFFEIVGFEPSGKAIMGIVDTSKLNDKAFSKQFANLGDGKSMVYKYGCANDQCDIFVYRITLTNEDGHSVDYSWDDVKKRCSELGVKHSPELDRFTVKEFKLRYDITDDHEFKEEFMNYVAKISDGADPTDPSHWSEGTCIRLESGLSVRIFKHKNFNFKVLEGIVKDSGFLDEEEAQSEVEIEADDTY